VNRFSLFEPADGFLHRLDPRTKLGVVGLTFILILLFNDPRYLGVVLLVAILAALSIGKAVRKLLGFGLALLPVLLATILLWPLFEQAGTTVFEWGWLRVTDLGLLFALAMALRISIPVLATLILFMTTRRRDIIAGLVKIGLPYPAGFGITIAFGLVPMLVGSGQTIVEAQRARALEINKGNILARLRKSASLIVPLMIGAIGSMQNLALSMEARGYGASRARTFLREPKFSTADRVTLAVLCIVLLAVVILRFLGYGALFTDRL
jgi:energy-coupling factor transport system permease protein